MKCYINSGSDFYQDNGCDEDSLLGRRQYIITNFVISSCDKFLDKQTHSDYSGNDIMRR